jgi:uncharacterized SAM-binding protein YcdF (DUF218 family)
VARGFASRRRRFRLVRLAFAAVLIAGALWLLGLVWFADRITRFNPGPDQAAESAHADAVVVLTGTPDRLAIGFDLLARGNARRMFVSGVSRGVDVQQILKALRRPPDEAGDAVVLGYGADDTAGNAQETALWMAKEGLTSIILVTSNFHMPRALLEFHAAMPDVTVIPHATAAASFKIADWWRWPGTVRLIASEWSKYIAARAVLATGLRMHVRGAVSPEPLSTLEPAASPPRAHPAENESGAQGESGAKATREPASGKSP